MGSGGANEALMNTGFSLASLDDTASAAALMNSSAGMSKLMNSSNGMSTIMNNSNGMSTLMNSSNTERANSSHSATRPPMVQKTSSMESIGDKSMTSTLSQQEYRKQWARIRSDASKQTVSSDPAPGV